MAFVPSLLRNSVFIPRTSINAAISPRSTKAARTFMSQKQNPLPDNPTVGFIGLGTMGLPMLGNLSKHFSDLVVWNRSDKQTDLDAVVNKSASVQIAANPADVVTKADITFSMLSTPEAVRSVFYEQDTCALSAISPGKCLVDCSTLRTEDMVSTYHEVTEQGGVFLEAPVSGSKIPAEQGQLIFLCAGDKGLYNDPITQKSFELMGKRSFYLGEIGNGTKMKLIINQLMATMLASLGESIVLTEALNLSTSDLLEVLSLGAMSNPMFSLKGPKMNQKAKDYTPHFPLEHAEKDVRFAQQLGRDYDIKMGVGAAAQEWYKSAKELGLSRDDFCAVIESIRDSANRK